MLIAKGVDKMKDLKEVMRAKLFDMKVLPLHSNTQEEALQGGLAHPKLFDPSVPSPLLPRMFVVSARE